MIKKKPWLKKNFCSEQVPALILDCEANIDFSRDVEAKEK
jgi:hypothetical protein